MHTSLPAWLALSSAILPTVTAFYPYHYGPDSTRSRRTPKPSSNTNVPSLTLPLRRVPTGLRTRQNAYDILNSNDPRQDNSVAIDQDGADLSYMVAVTFGDSKEEYHMLLDSAASNTWVMGQDCTSAACKTHSTFGKGDSSTLKVNLTYLYSQPLTSHKANRNETPDQHGNFQRNLRHRLFQRHPRNRHTTHWLALALANFRPPRNFAPTPWTAS
jgi:hypothetical protein